MIIAHRLVEVGKETSGDPAKFRVELAPYWPVTVAYVKHKTGVDLSSRIIQAQGGAQLSAGTHWDGAAVDLRTRGLTRAKTLAVVAALRELGWAAWYREGGSWVGNEHIHAAANLGMTLTTGCLYQVRAYKAGFNGLGSMGRGGKDPHPRPDTIRTIADGARWAAAQIQSEEDDMPLTDADYSKIAEKVWGATFGSATETAGARLGRAAANSTTAAARVADINRDKPISLRQEVADTKTLALALQGQLAGLATAIGQLAGGRIDMAAVEAAARRGAEDALADLRVVTTIEQA